MPDASHHDGRLSGASRYSAMWTTFSGSSAITSSSSLSPATDGGSSVRSPGRDGLLELLPIGKARPSADPPTREGTRRGRPGDGFVEIVATRETPRERTVEG